MAVMVVASMTVAAHQGGQGQERAAFEVVSIRPAAPPPLGTSMFVLPDAIRVIGSRLQATNISAAALVRAAYGREFGRLDQIIGEDWIRSERFNVDARASSVLSETPTSDLPPAVGLMLQQVLQDRFQLRVRRETRQLPRYVLTYARADRSLKAGIRVSGRDCTAKLEVAGPCEFRPSPGQFVMRGRPIQAFVDFLSRPAYIDRAVVDDTGITGHVDIDLQWTLNFNDLPSSHASLLTSVQEQLGLKLEPRQVPLPVVVIEQIQRPSDN
jgi:uncharacterized protein (TIGR03435 family)